jgi:HAD superfamily hydrolase (TIGR01509 family)
MFDAVLFDLDGTLIDTESVSIRTGLEVLAAMGHPVDPMLLHSMIGKDNVTSDRILQERMPDLDIRHFGIVWRQAFHDAIDQELVLKPAADHVLATIRLPLGLVTSSSRPGAESKIAMAGWSGRFSVVVSCDDVRRTKPEPEPYLQAAKALGTDPSRCLVFEDSEVGAEAAFRAGCTVVQVPDILPATGRWAHHVAENLLVGARMAGLDLPEQGF